MRRTADRPPPTGEQEWRAFFWAVEVTFLLAAAVVGGVVALTTGAAEGAFWAGLIVLLGTAGNVLFYLASTD